MEILAQVETLSNYDQVPIVIGMIICLLVIMFSIKYLTPKKIQISGFEAMDITMEMLDKVKGVTIDGSTIEKRASSLQHNVNEALSAENRDTLLVVLTDLKEGLIKIDDNMQDAYKELAERDNRHHEERMGLQKSLNKKIIELANKRR